MAEDFETHPVGTQALIDGMQANLDQAKEAIDGLRKVMSLMGALADDSISLSEFKRRLEALDEST